MEDQVQAVISKVLQIMTPHLGDQKYTLMYPEPDERYSDSFLRVHRKGSGFLGTGSPDPSTPIDLVEVNITFKPGVLQAEWIGYTVSFDPKTMKINGMSEWKMNSGETTPDYAIFSQLAPHILALLDRPLLPTEPPRQAPSNLF